MIVSQMELKPPPAPPSETTSLPPTLFLFQVDEVILENECVKKKKERKAKNGQMQPDYVLQHLQFMSIFAAFDLYLYSAKGLFITQAALMLNGALSFHQNTIKPPLALVSERIAAIVIISVNHTQHLVTRPPCLKAINNLRRLPEAKVKHTWRASFADLAPPQVRLR